MSNKSINAIEFFSGIGAFHNAVQTKPISVTQAFDQNEDANKVYVENFDLKPSNKNLDSIKKNQIKESNFWWMSPPCTPFTRRGKKKDDEDPRSKAFMNLINLLKELKPDYLIIENVEGFINSRVHSYLLETIKQSGFYYKEINLCSTDFGVPMRRPRFFIVASRVSCPKLPEISDYQDKRPLLDYLQYTCQEIPQLQLPDQTLTRYRNVLNIVDFNDPSAQLICFTRGYHRCNKASGSLLRFDKEKIKYVHPADIAELMGFGREFIFPDELSLIKQWKLIGNSVDVRAINFLVDMLGF